MLKIKLEHWRPILSKCGRYGKRLTQKLKTPSFSWSLVPLLSDAEKEFLQYRNQLFLNFFPFLFAEERMYKPYVITTHSYRILIRSPMQPSQPESLSVLKITPKSTFSRILSMTDTTLSPGFSRTHSTEQAIQEMLCSRYVRSLLDWPT
jgi:hypothetical protein